MEIPDECSILLPPGLKAAWMSPIEDRPPFDALEDAETRGMRPGRATEFRAGRWLARDALAQLGPTAERLLRRESRDPVWPAGFIGSISHTNLAAIAVAARSDSYLSVGVDLELRRTLDEPLLGQVCTPRELTWLDTIPETRRREIPTVVFSTKESAYKCQYPVTETLLDFLDCEASIDLDNQAFKVVIPALRIGADAELVVSGRWALIREHVLTIGWLPAASTEP